MPLIPEPRTANYTGPVLSTSSHFHIANYPEPVLSTSSHFHITAPNPDQNDFNPLRHNGCYIYHLCILAIKSTNLYVSCTSPSEEQLFRKEPQLTDICNVDAVCFVRDRNWIFNSIYLNWSFQCVIINLPSLSVFSSRGFCKYFLHKLCTHSSFDPSSYTHSPS